MKCNWKVEEIMTKLVTIIKLKQRPDNNGNFENRDACRNR